MRQTYELPVVYDILSQTTGRYCHAALYVAIQLRLGTIILFKVVDELLGGGGELQLLSAALKTGPDVLDLLNGGFFPSGKDMNTAAIWPLETGTRRH